MNRLTLLSLAVLTACRSDSSMDKVNDLPTITITSHADGSTFGEGETVELRAQVNDDNDDIETLQVVWYNGEEVVCDWATPDPAGYIYCDITFAPEDTAIIVEVVDPKEMGDGMS